MYSLRRFGSYAYAVRESTVQTLAIGKEETFCCGNYQSVWSLRDILMVIFFF